MTIFKNGDMWDGFGKVDLFCITVNGTFNSNGELVMGKGIALELKARIPNIVKNAAVQLKQYLELSPYALPSSNPKMTVCLNFPGIGCGKLNRNEVFPIIELLPDNVEVWEYNGTKYQS